VKPRRIYASKGCYLRAHKGLAQQMGREGGKTAYIVRGAAIVEKFAHLDRDQAILAAIQWGEKRSRQRAYRERRRA
jgi:hypothetical protein